jgi:hypothetical protein
VVKIYKVGDRVIPFQKTYPTSCSLKDCGNWRRAKERKQPFLYVHDVIPEREKLILTDEIGRGGGNNYHFSDVIPYLEDPERAFAMLVRGQINDEQYKQMINKESVV